MAAKLSEKEKIKTLVLAWSLIRESSSSIIKFKDVLEGLQPHPNIQNLEIENYQGRKFPPWLLIPKLNNLVVVKLKGCEKCEKIPELGHFPRLEILELEGLHSASWIGSEDKTLFPALKRVSLKDMKSLLEWKVPEPAAGGTKVAFPCLEELSIYSCPELERIPSMSHFSSKLTRLTIADCDALRHISSEFHASTTSLKDLSTGTCSNLASIPSLQNCTALEVLDIYGCENVESIILELHSVRRVTIYRCRKASVRISWPLSCATIEQLEVHFCRELIFFYDDDDTRGSEFRPSSRLQSLFIWNCAYFKSVPDGLNRRLHSLIQLKISDCWNLSHMPEDFFCGLNQLKEELRIGGFSEELKAFPGMNSIQHLGGSLEKLEIIGWRKLKSLPHQLQHLNSLTKLKILDFEGAEFDKALPDWLANLSSLQMLTIWRCENLPSSGAMQRLSILTFLSIWKCPLLKQNCEMGSGSEWPKISHIPSLYIDW